MEQILDAQVWIGLLTLTALEIVLGIDNVIFISILAGRLRPALQKKARLYGLALAMVMRVLLLVSLSWIMNLTRPLFAVGSFAISGRALILITGGLFLLAKSTREIHHRIEGNGDGRHGDVAASFGAILFQIVILDVVFSLDSVITAVGMVDEIIVMITAVVLAVVVMMIFAGVISAFIDRHPTLKMLALSFLLLIGVNLIGDGLGFHIPKAYTYFAMGFSLSVEILNLKVRKPKRRRPATA